MDKHGFKTLCMLLVTGVILFVAGQNALAYNAGWEAVDEYHRYLPDMENRVSEGEKFEDDIYDYSTSWTVDFGWADDNAWEEDFKMTSLGGNDVNYADNVDLVLFAGHGDEYGFYFGSTVDDHQLRYSDAEWGDEDLEWIMIDASNVLSVCTRWMSAFQGLHYILGYYSECYDVDTRGEDFIRYAMYYGYTVRVAWIYATIDSEDGTRAAYMRPYQSGADTYNDHLWGFGSVSADPTPPFTSWYCMTWNT